MRDGAVREKLKMTNLLALLVKGTLNEESTMKARYLVALQDFSYTGEKPPQFVLCRNMEYGLSKLKRHKETSHTDLANKPPDSFD